MKLILFDLDGTLAEATKEVNSDMKKRLLSLKENNFDLGIVSGGTFKKIQSQIMDENLFKFIFSENGMIGYESNNKFFEKTLNDSFTKQEIDNLFDTINRNIGDIYEDVNMNILKKSDININHLPKIEERNAMLYLVPSGVGCNDTIRSCFMEINNNECIRNEIIDRLKEPLFDLGFNIKIGGNVGLAISPLGWDKSFILKNNILKLDNYEMVYFFGDKCHEDGNDYPIFSYEGIEGYHVNNPEHTLELLKNF